MSRTGVVLTNLGGPDIPEAIAPFLENLFSDPLILAFGQGFLRRFVARKIAKGPHDPAHERTAGPRTA